MAKEMQYADLGADAMLAKNKKIGMFRGLGHASWAFCRHFFLRRGFLDGEKSEQKGRPEAGLRKSNKKMNKRKNRQGSIKGRL